MRQSLEEKIAAGRLPCCVPGCGRTFKRKDGETDETEVICGKHWRLADSRPRRLYTAIRKKGNKWGWSPQLEALFHRNWQRIKTQVIERAMGI